MVLEGFAVAAINVRLRQQIRARNFSGVFSTRIVLPLVLIGVQEFAIKVAERAQLLGLFCMLCRHAYVTFAVLSGLN